MRNVAMLTKNTELNLQSIENILKSHGSGQSAQQIHAELEDVPLRTLQYWLKRMVSEKRVIQEGATRSTRYRLPDNRYRFSAHQHTHQVSEPDEVIVLARDAKAVQDYIRQPLSKRKPVGYEHGFLDCYRPNISHYLSAAEREHLHAIGQSGTVAQVAGTHARYVLNRLLIDLSWNSSRLEGNTYSLLDTRRLLDFGEVAQGRNQIETQMILNHKDAIEFLVEASDDIGFNRYTLLNLHAMLANNLLADPLAEGKLRHIAVGIGHSAFLPLDVPPLIESYFDLVLKTASAIKDPFEQALFVMVQLPYLQPFDDVNKRVSRLAVNIPLIRHNLAPLSFVQVPNNIYTEAVLGVYELNDISLLKTVFIWAYERSAARYVSVKQTLGEPDPFRLRYGNERKVVVGEVVRQKMSRKAALAFIAGWAAEHIDAPDREAFRVMAEEELLNLHEGNFARYGVRPAEFVVWAGQW